MSKASRDNRREQSLRDLISSRFEYFLAVLVVAVSISVVLVALIGPIIVALIGPVIDTSLSQAVAQGMIAIFSGVTGFFFGNRGVERAEERVRELENELTTGIQPRRIKKELLEIRDKMIKSIDQAQEASNRHYENQKREADRYFRNTDESINDCYDVMKAWIYGNYAYLKLDEAQPTSATLIKESLDMFKKSEKFRDDTDFPDDLFPKRTSLGKAVAQMLLEDYENTVKSFNEVGEDISKMEELIDDYIKKEGVKESLDKLLKSSFAHNLGATVRKYLEKVKSEYEQNNRYR